MTHPATQTGLDRVFDALANEHRREMIRVLSVQPASISQLASLRALSLPAIHKHVAALEEAGMVIRKKVGRTNFLALSRDPLRRLQEWTNEFHPYWGSDSETLENYVSSISKEETSNEEEV
jgi:DNA-binding transcriptional ArsR family regulator